MRFENLPKIPTSFGCANLPVTITREGCQRVGLPIPIQIREYWYYKLPMQQQSGLNWSMSHSTLAASLLSMADNCTSMKDFKRIHARTIRTGLHLNSHILGKMFRFLSVSPSGDLQYAHHMFTQMPQPNTFFYNILIRGYSKSQNPSQSICLFNQMRRNSVDPDEFTFTFLLKARSKMCSLIQMAATDEIHGHVLKFGFCSHLHVQNTLLHLYARKGIPVAAHRVFEETVDPDVVSWSGLVFAHVLAGELDEARNILEEMPDKDVVAWTTLISGYSKAKRSKDVLELFRRMQEMGIKPDEVTMICVISSCTNLGDLESGLNVHRYIDDNGFGWMISLCNALIDMYGKCGCVERARRVFDSMEKKSLISWNSMISGYANHGYMEEAIGLFQEMLDSGVSPDDVTFLAVLGACTHKGNVEEGCTLFESMKRNFDIEPRIEHYGCMVDLLGRAGRLEEAYELIINMPIPSNDVVWGALLGACRIYANVDMGERIVKRLLELKPDEGGYYILLRDIYAAAGRRMEAIEIRRTMDTAGVRKTPGCSWVGA